MKRVNSFDLQGRPEEKDNSLEDFVDAISSLPHEIQRSYNLIRFLDKKTEDLNSEIAEEEKRYLLYLKRKIRESNDKEKALKQIVEDTEPMEQLRKRRRARRALGAEKVAAAAAARALVARALAAAEEHLQRAAHHPLHPHGGHPPHGHGGGGAGAGGRLTPTKGQ